MSCAEEIISRSESASMVRRLGLSWPMLLGASAFLLALVSGAIQIDPDAYWHIIAGRWIFSHGYVPAYDMFSFTRHGAPWVAQEWGAELLFAFVHGLAGWAGLTVLAALSFALAIAYLTRFLVARMEPLHAVLLGVLAGCMMSYYMLVRPHELVWPLTAVWMGVLIESREAGRAPPWWLLVVMLAWVNLHGSFILGLGLVVMIALEAVVDAKERWRVVGRCWGGFVAAAFGCALLNPRGWHLLVFPFHLLGMHVLRQLVDWQPTNLARHPVMGVWLVVILGFAFSGKIRLSPVRAVTLVGLIYFALEYARNVSLLGLIAPFLIAAPLAAQWRRMPKRGRGLQALEMAFRALHGPGRLAAWCATVAVAGVLGIVAVTAGQPRPLEFCTPRAALNVLLSSRPKARIFNDANFGGYLIFHGIPVFVDPRVDVYGDTFLRQYYDAIELNPGGDISALLDRYRINAILIGPEWPVVRLLDRSPQWRRVYADKVAVVYLRRPGHYSAFGRPASTRSMRRSGMSHRSATRA